MYHPFHLAEQMEDEKTTIIALLHDIVEDTNYTINDLLSLGFDGEIVDAVALMTHDKSVPYMHYIGEIAKNPIARKVKLADLKHNSDLSRLNTVTDKDIKRIEKYKSAIALLEIEK